MDDDKPVNKGEVRLLRKAVSHRVVATWVLTVLVLGLAGWFAMLVNREAEQRQDALCAIIDKNRSVVRELVVESGARRRPLNEVAGFDDLDPATQRFFVSLSTPPPPGESFVDRALAVLDASDEADGCPD